MRIQRAKEQEPRDITLTRPRYPGRKSRVEIGAEAVGLPGPGRPARGADQPGASGALAEAIDTWRTTFGMSPQGSAAGKLLRERIWEPIEAKLQGAKIVLISPDGVLGRLPLGALPGKEPGSYLIEEYTLASVPVPQLIPEMVARGRPQAVAEEPALDGQYRLRCPADTVRPRHRQTLRAGEPCRKTFAIRTPARHASRGGVDRKLYHDDVGKGGILSLQDAQATKAAFLAAGRRATAICTWPRTAFLSKKSCPLLRRSASGWRGFGEMLQGRQPAG